MAGIGNVSNIGNVGNDYTESYKKSQDCTVTVEKISKKQTPADMGKAEAEKNDSAVVAKDKKEPTEKQIKAALEQANHHAKMKNTLCEFSYDEDTKRILIKVKDKETDEVIREIPGEETLEMISKIWELAGILVDKRA